MTGFDPGEGWREVHVEEATCGKRTVREFDEEGMTEHVWVREVLVPPLPTEPYTVIRAHWNDPAFGDVMWLAQDGTWRYGNGDRVHTADPAEGMSGFEVLSEPRAVTAKAVLDRVRQFQERGLVGSDLDAIAREFGVTA